MRTSMRTLVPAWVVAAMTLPVAHAQDLPRYEHTHQSNGVESELYVEDGVAELWVADVRGQGEAWVTLVGGPFDGRGWCSLEDAAHRLTETLSAHPDLFFGPGAFRIALDLGEEEEDEGPRRPGDGGSSGSTRSGAPRVSLDWPSEIDSVHKDDDTVCFDTSTQLMVSIGKLSAFAPGPKKQRISADGKTKTEWQRFDDGTFWSRQTYQGTQPDGSSQEWVQESTSKGESTSVTTTNTVTRPDGSSTETRTTTGSTGESSKNVKEVTERDAKGKVVSKTMEGKVVDVSSDGSKHVITYKPKEGGGWTQTETLYDPDGKPTKKTQIEHDKQGNPTSDKPVPLEDEADQDGAGAGDPGMPSEDGYSAGGEVCYPAEMFQQLINWNRLGDSVTYPSPLHDDEVLTEYIDYGPCGPEHEEEAALSASMFVGDPGDHVTDPPKH